MLGLAEMNYEPSDRNVDLRSMVIQQCPSDPQEKEPQVVAADCDLESVV